MRLFNQSEDDITRRLVRVLIGLAFKNDALALHRTSGDVNLEDLLFLACSLALALLASVLLLENLASALAMVAKNSLTSHHAGADLSEGLDDTVTLATFARRSLGLLLATRTLTLTAEHLFVGGKLDSLTTVKLFQGHLVLLLLIRATSGSTRAAGAARTSRASGTHAETEHLGKDIVEVDLRTAGATAGLVESGHTVNIVKLALLLIAENFVGLCDFLELGF
ncbi:hypothetical protein HG531_000580 [Fusarium graminearum]|nr:hypothetical protein HG531_000580 [Fusarium graminearum]